MSAIRWIRQRGALLLTTAAVVFVLDQVTKYLATILLGPTGPMERLDILGSWLRFDYVTNSGAAFGFLQDRTLFFSIVAFLAIPVLLVFYNNLPKESLIPRLCIGLLLGGTVGNLADRVRFGYVVDFIDAGVGHLRWPTFNVADSAFVVGVFILAFHLLLSADKTDKRGATSQN
ncbi:MAG: signal peptidase II [Chloroflexi bacterium]|nr:signal peptidase II [Chloroflexota bacterium]